MKVSLGKNDPSRALNCINHFELSEVTLSFVEWCIHFGNGTCHLQVFPPFASPNIAGLSVTNSGYWHQLLPAMSPRNHHLKNHWPFHKASHSIQRNSRYFSKGEWSIFFKKEREREREAHSPFQVANYGVQINPNERPSISSTPYPPKTPCSMRPGFG